MYKFLIYCDVGRSKRWVGHQNNLCDGNKSNGWWVGHLGIHEELSYGQSIMEHVKIEGSKCLRDVGRIVFISL